jgi:O-antigen ligase
MTALSSDVASRLWARAVGIEPRPAYRTLSLKSRSSAVRMLQVFAVCLMVFPSNIAFKPVGADGYPAGLVAMFAFAVWITASLLGLHDAHRNRHPIRGVLCFFWVTGLISYIVMQRGLMDSAQLLSADRYLMMLASITGIALVAAEGLNSLDDIRRVLRVLAWGGAFCGLVAALQFRLNYDLTHYLQSIPGFTANHAAFSGISDRGGLHRVTGTATDPIELGVAAAILLPVAIWSAIYDTDQRRWRWVPVILITASIAASVSRSAIIGVALSVGMFIVLMPPRQRLAAFAVLPVALAGVFFSAHGLIGTLAAWFGAGNSDPSVAHRTNNYPYVEQLVRHHPWFGQGGGTYIATIVHILDNQYLTTAITLGLVGVLALALLFVIPMITALRARKRSENPELRLLCAALASGTLAALVCSATFDSLSFPMFYSVAALVIGLSGAAWRLARAEASARTSSSHGVASPTLNQARYHPEPDQGA